MSSHRRDLGKRKIVIALQPLLPVNWALVFLYCSIYCIFYTTNNLIFKCWNMVWKFYVDSPKMVWTLALDSWAAIQRPKLQLKNPRSKGTKALRFYAFFTSQTIVPCDQDFVKVMGNVFFRLDLIIGVPIIWRWLSVSRVLFRADSY